MLSRSVQLRRRYTIGLIDKVLKRDGPQTKFYDLAYQPFWPPTEEAPELASAKVLSENDTSPVISTLPNGVRVITQPTNVPGQIHMNLLLGVGSRDETTETSGSLHSIQLTRYKSSLITNETVNYGMVQMSGGSYDLTFDREVLSAKASCLDHDVVDIFSMMSDCVLEPRSLLAANVALEKLPFSHKRIRSANKHHDLDDTVMSSIYGFQGLGNKLLGDETNIKQLNAFTLQRFQIQNFSTDKMVVSAIGVQNHHEFLELVDMKMGDLQYLGSEKNSRVASQFTENRLVMPQKANAVDVVLCWEGVSWDSPDLLTLQLMDTLLGGVEASHFEAVMAPDGELYSNFYLKEPAVNGVEAFSQHYSDSGVFGLRMNAQAQEAPDALSRLLQTTKTMLTNPSQDQFTRAKQRLRMRVLRALDNPPTRAEEMSRNMLSLDKVAFADFLGTLENLSLKDFSKQAQKVLRGKLNVTAVGGNAERIPELSELKKLVA